MATIVLGPRCGPDLATDTHAVVVVGNRYRTKQVALLGHTASTESPERRTRDAQQAGSKSVKQVKINDIK